MKVERINKNTGKVEQREIKTIERNDIAPGCKQIDINDLFSALYGKQSVTNQRGKRVTPFAHH